MRPPRAPTASSCWRGAGAPSPLDPRSRGWLIRRRLSLPIPGRNRLLEIVSMPRTPIFSPRGATESRAMNLPATFGESLVPGTATVHLGVPLHDFVVRDAIDLLFHRELILGFPQIDDPAGGRVALELRDHELPLPPTGLERRHHLGAIEDAVAIAHVEVRADRLALIHEQVLHRRVIEFLASSDVV